MRVAAVGINESACSCCVDRDASTGRTARPFPAGVIALIALSQRAMFCAREAASVEIIFIASSTLQVFSLHCDRDRISVAAMHKTFVEKHTRSCAEVHR